LRGIGFSAPGGAIAATALDVERIDEDDGGGPRGTLLLAGVRLSPIRRFLRARWGSSRASEFRFVIRGALSGAADSSALSPDPGRIEKCAQNVLAMIGIYGKLSYAVVRRTR
jgi:hypothetical protein